jgi:hypothetical protein
MHGKTSLSATLHLVSLKSIELLCYLAENERLTKLYTESLNNLAEQVHPC